MGVLNMKAKSLQVFLLLVLLVGPALSECPPGVPGWISGGSGSCYHKSIFSLTWLESVEYCNSLGGYLLEINSAEEQQLIESLVTMESGVAYWIGLHKREDSRWEWQESKSEPTFTNWGEVSPTILMPMMLKESLEKIVFTLTSPKIRTGSGMTSTV